jgi:RNA polymerase sigma-70 factor (ECF subfamily)
MDSGLEKTLIQQAQKDPKAFADIFEEYYPMILKYTLYRTGNAEVSRDIASEVFFKALRNLWRFRFTGAPFLAWLYRIAGNEIITYFRKNKYRPMSLEAAAEERGMEFSSREDLQEEIMQAQEQLEANAVFIQVLKALRTMPVIYQEVIALRFLDEHSLKEICGILEKKEGTVKSLLSRGLKMLREKMDGAQPFESLNVNVKEKEAV